MNQVVICRNTKQIVSMVDVRQWYQLAQLDGDTRLVEKVCFWYSSLVQTVAGEQVVLLPDAVASLLRISTELVLFAFEDDFLVGTAQASLLRPAGRPEVVISNVVVESSRHGRGYGTDMVRRLETLAGDRWSPGKPFRLRAELPCHRSAKFFANLGYTVKGEVLAHKVKW
jgi:predicted GNAT family N-acyltransferase